MTDRGAQKSGNRRTRELFALAHGAVMISGVLAAAASAQSSPPDAQVESNVLKALAGAPELATQAITTRTVYGTVTLSGTVRDESLRTMAETLAANANGVKKVVDELRLGDVGAVINREQSIPAQPGAGQVLLSDGTYGPAGQAAPAPGSADAEMSQRNNPDLDQQLDRQVQPSASLGSDQSSAPMPASNQQQTQGAPPSMRRPLSGAPGYPPYGYPSGSGYGPQSPQADNGQQPWGGQTPGQVVSIPSGAMVRVRINRTLASDRVQPGTTFDGIVVNDVVAGGFIAIPRGASVQGKVIDAKGSGVLKGRGELSIALTQVTLAGKTFPIETNVWEHHGGDKTIETVNKTAIGGGIGALIGAVAGGGVGAAVGAGIGGAAGLGSSAASGNGQVVIPSEGIVTFQLAQQASVETVSEQEMQRLAYGVPPGADQRYARPRNYPRVYVGPEYPVYYPYGPYGYPRY